MSSNKSNLLNTFEKITKDIEELKTQKSDTTNLKNSYQEFSQIQIVENGKRQAHINIIEVSLNNLILRVDEAMKKLKEIESIEF